MQITDNSSRMTPEDIDVLKAMFGEREGAVEAIRKIFLPTLAANNPILVNNDIWTGSAFTLEGMTPEEKVSAVELHIKLVKHLEGCLGVVKALVGNKGESAEQTLNRIQKDSTK